MESFDYDFGLLVDSFIEYANKNRFFPSKDEVMRLILDFVDKYDDGTGDLSRKRKDSFYWYKKVIESNGEIL